MVVNLGQVLPQKMLLCPLLFLAGNCFNEDQNNFPLVVSLGSVPVPWFGEGLQMILLLP